MDLKNYKLVFNDEFDCDGMPDPEKWGYETGNHQWPNRELQAYTDRPDNVFIKDGKLTIRSIKQKDGQREYTSAKLTTRDKFSWQYGYFEFKARFPKGSGSWPAIWMMPEIKHKPLPLPPGIPLKSDGRPDFQNMTEEQRRTLPRPPEKDRWPNCGEIDIVEHIGRNPDSVLFSLHSKNHNHRRKDTAVYTVVSEFERGYFDDFRTFGMEWTADYVEYFVDGVSKCRFNKSDDEDQSYDSWPFDRPFHLIINTAVGGGLGGPVDEALLPYEFVLDYVRIYQKK